MRDTHLFHSDRPIVETSFDWMAHSYLDRQYPFVRPNFQADINCNRLSRGFNRASSPPGPNYVHSHALSGGSLSPDPGPDLDSSDSYIETFLSRSSGQNTGLIRVDPGPDLECDGSFCTSTFRLNPTPIPVARAQIDFNGDGESDLLWRNYTTGQNQIWFINGTTVVSSVLTTEVRDTDWRLQATGDFNNDQQTDLVWRHIITGENAIWLMNATSRVSGIFTTPVPDINWQIRGAEDFNGDGNSDLLWRRESSGETVVWLMNGTSYASHVVLPTVPGLNLSIQGVNDFNDDGYVDILWRNRLSGENLAWLMNGTAITSTVLLESFSDTNWQVQLTDDLNRDGKADILWRNQATGENLAWLMNGLTVERSLSYAQPQSLAWSTAPQDAYTLPHPISLSNLVFSGQEGDTGTFQIRLTQAPASNVTLTLTTGNFLVVDADGNVANGTQNSITFTPSDWNQVRTVWFIAEIDDSSNNRPLGNTVSYTLSGGLTGSGVYDLATVTNNPVHNPDPTRFNIALDFRNDYLGFWTPERRAIAQQAADAWAKRIDNEWSALQLNHSLARLDQSSFTYSFTSRRFVDDLLVFVNPFASPTAESFGGVNYEFGGWTTPTSPPGAEMPRVGQISIATSLYSPTYIGNNIALGNAYLYNVVAHELGHVLGLVGMNWTGYNRLETANPQTAVFRGQVSGTIPLQSQDGPNPVTGTYDYFHPAARVQSIMSYGWIYQVDGILDGVPSSTNYVEGPTEIDFAMLADSGYRINGYNGIPVT